MGEVYIIERDGNVKFYKLSEEDNYHSSYFKKYIKENNIDINEDNLTSYEYGIRLSKIGLLSIIVENRNMLIFVPEIISNDQFNWLINRKKALINFCISYSYIENKESKCVESKENKKSSVKDFYKYIKSNIQNQKEGELDEHRKAI